MKKISGAGARQKGLNFERKIVSLIKHIYPKAERQLESQHGFGYDIANTGCYKIQAKKHKNYTSISKIEETYKSLEDGDIPILITAGDRKIPMAVMPLEHFIKLVEYYENYLKEHDIAVEKYLSEDALNE